MNLLDFRFRLDTEHKIRQLLIFVSSVLHKVGQQSSRIVVIREHKGVHMGVLKRARLRREAPERKNFTGASVKCQKKCPAGGHLKQF